MWRAESSDVSSSRVGEFELERRDGHWDGGEETGHWWVLRRCSDRSVLLDTSNVKWASACWHRDGVLLLVLQRVGNRRLLRVEPDRGTFCDLARRDGPQPIEALQSAVDRAAREAAPPSE